MPAIINPKLDLASPEACPSVKVAPENVVILEVDNLLHGWPTYILDYTPEYPGPVKFILRFKDVKKYVYVDDEESEGEGGFVTRGKPTKNDRDATSISVDLTGSVLQMNSDAKATKVDATPINLLGTLKDPRPTKKRAFASYDNEPPTWPPLWPRSAYREVSTDRPTDAFSRFKTTPALIQAVNDTTTAVTNEAA